MKKMCSKVLLLGFVGFLVTGGILLGLNYLDNQLTTKEKPVIYLYPEKEQQVDVKLDFQGELTCTYPEYKNGWNVIAQPDGSIYNLDDNRKFSYLFWEGQSDKKWTIDKGFVIEGSKTKDFLQETLAKIGLNEKEYNEFIVYWLPLMQDNKYNLIYFAGQDYEEIAPLDISPKPDSMLRVFMVYKPLDEYMKIEKQELDSFERKGFSVVEWGGTEIN
ncbi:MAG: hypothetical protein PHD60_00445 [Clostridia bacterium]|nr:hypothetical protein [Clostridia bacterium]